MLSARVPIGCPWGFSGRFPKSIEASGFIIRRIFDRQSSSMVVHIVSIGAWFVIILKVVDGYNSDKKRIKLHVRFKMNNREMHVTGKNFSPGLRKTPVIVFMQ